MLRLHIENTLDREEKIMAEWITTTLEECTDILMLKNLWTKILYIISFPRRHLSSILRAMQQEQQ